MEAQVGDVVDAGFLRRWAAIFLDQLLLTGAMYALIFVGFFIGGAAFGFSFDTTGEIPPWIVFGYVLAFGGYYLVAGLYYSLMESSASQATLGKMALGIKVVDAHGQRLAWPHALGRWAAAALSYLTFYLGFLAACFTDRKQALHDLLAKTFVVDKWAYTEFPERQQRGLSGCLIAFLIVMGLMIAVAGLGIVAAIALPAYQDYTVKARAASALLAVRPLQEAVAASGRCDGDTGAQGPYVARAEYLDLDDGRCQITVWLSPRQGSSESSDWLSFQKGPDESAWTCLSNLRAPQLPAGCR